MSRLFPESNCADLGCWPWIGNLCCAGCAAVAWVAILSLVGCVVWIVWRWVS